jgi:hypothetical protein
MNVDGLIHELKKFSDQGQGKLPVVNYEDNEVSGLEANDDGGTLAVVIEF